jgi:5-oxopent-3-ene-1,2,5-tricarboxylate decarboxylase/2-hydroxyhepta-2,4-diene-1,7-dioate isomerase
MREVRFAADGMLQHGVSVEDDTVLISDRGKSYKPDEVQFLPPVQPTKVIGLALNFADHAEELGLGSPEEPALFFKPLTSLIGHKAPVVAPPNIEYMHYEVELAVVIGRAARKVKAADAMDYVLGYTIANDVTVRDFVHNMFRPPIKAKGFDTFGPLGPYLVTGEIDDPHNLALRAYVNGELRQKFNTRDMAFTFGEYLEHLSKDFTFYPGDMIASGTAKGTAADSSPLLPDNTPSDEKFLHAGDTVEIKNPIIGTLRTKIVAKKNR